jgi:hypothetical protein
MGCGCKKNKKTQIQSPVVTEVPNGASTILSETEPLYLKRIEICNSCNYRDAEAERCMACGCFIKAKARIMLSRCPLDEPRW